MPVLDKSPYIAYVANGATSYAYDFRVFKDTDLVVSVAGAVKTLATDYTVTGVGADNGGEVVFSAIPAPGRTIEIERILPFSREIDYQYGGAFREQTVDDDQDYQTMLLQQVASTTDRSLLVPKGQAGETVDVVEYDNRAGKVLGWNSFGKLALMAMNFVTSSGALANPWADVRGYASLADAVAQLGGLSIDLHVPNVIEVADDLIVPANICLVIKMGGRINVSAGATLTINGPVAVGQLFMTFSGSGAVIFNSAIVGAAGWFDSSIDVTFNAGLIAPPLYISRHITLGANVSVREVYPEWWGADSNGYWHTAIQAAVDAGFSVQLLKRTYDINDTITVGSSSMQKFPILRGISRNDTTIVQHDVTKPVLTLNRFCGVSHLHLKHASNIDSAVAPNGIGIGINNRMERTAYIRDCHIENTTRAIASLGMAWAYSSTFENIEINYYTDYGIYANDSGATGNVYTNIYIVNWRDYGAQTKNTARAGIYFLGNHSGGVISQLNIEHTVLQKAAIFSGVRNMQINSLHIEGFVAGQAYGSVIWLDGGSNVRLNGLEVTYSVFDTSVYNPYSLATVDTGSRLRIDGVDISSNTLIGTNNRRFFRTGATAAPDPVLEIKNVKSNDKFTGNDYLPVSSSEIVSVTHYNGTDYSLVINGKRVRYASAAPTTGTWAPGDHVINAAPAVGQPRGWRCVVGGSPGTWVSDGNL